MGDEATVRKAHAAMAAGCVGLIFGRNTWQRKWDEALSMASRIHDVLNDYGQQQ
jgi:class I fructose-bisphosphate aldolase